MRLFERGTGRRRLAVTGVLYVVAVSTAIAGTIALWYAVGRVIATLGWTMLGGAFVLLFGTLPTWYGAGVPTAVAGAVVGATVGGGVAATTWLLVRAVHRSQRRLLADTRAPTDDERVHEATLDRLARQVDVPTPELRVRESSRSLSYTLRDELGVVDAPTSDGDTYVVVTPALLDRLDDDELEGVLAHEVAHVANGDLWLLSLLLAPVLWAERLLAQARVGAERARRMDSLVEGLLGVVVAVAAGTVGRVLHAVSSTALVTLTRGREYDADRGAATITDDPTALASAIERLAAADTATVPEEDGRAVDAGARATTAAMTVVSTAERGPLAHVGGTHPSTEDRVAALTEIARD